MATEAFSTEPEKLAIARRLRAVCATLEFTLFAIVGTSVAALASVRASAYIPLGIACLGVALLILLRAATLRTLQGILGRQRRAFQFSNGSVWSIDLATPAFPKPPLLLPGIVFLGWAGFQLLPLPAAIISLLRAGEVGAEWQSLTLATSDTLRGLGFLAGALVLHVAAGAVFANPESRARFRRFLAVLGALVTFAALIQQASGSPLIYGVFAPIEAPKQVSYGPFVNRNHFAGYLLMVIPMCMALMARSYKRYARHLGERTGMKHHVVAMGSREGTALLYATVPVLVALGGLIASTSRGAQLAFVISMAVAALSIRKGEVPTWLLALAFTGMTLSWFGLERLEARYMMAEADAPARTLVWKDALGRMDGRWLTGTGFNSFGAAMSHVELWALPVGASPLSQPVAELVASGSRFGERALVELNGYSWYAEAHNDYIQVLVETGIPGLLVALWGIAAMLRAARRDPWLVAALVAVLLHSFVDFDLQIPAVAVLFVVLAAMRPRVPRKAEVSRGEHGSRPEGHDATAPAS